MIDGYTDIAIVVSDAQKAKRWYLEKLGFKVVLDRGHAICVSPNVKGEGAIVLHLCGDGFSPLEPGNTGIGFTADDFARTCEELARKGGRILDAADGRGRLQDGKVSRHGQERVLVVREQHGEEGLGRRE